MKLLIPGPVNVEAKYLNSMQKPMIGHRSRSFENLHKEIVILMRELFKTKNDVFLITASASGSMEGAIRNLADKKVLCLANGDFGRRWHEIALLNGKNSELLDFGDAVPYDADRIKEKLSSENYDAVAMVINETTAGIENDVEKIKQLLEGYSETLLLADAVTAAFGTNIDVEGIDVLLFGTQKALALPPGLSISIVSEKALKKASEVKNRGYYFDYVLMKKNADKNFTVTTPNISLLFALRDKLEDIKIEGIDNYIGKHRMLANLVRTEMKEMGFELLVDDENASSTVTVIKNTRNINVKELQEEMRKKGFELANGYGALKDITFRFGHMGLDEETTREAINGIKCILKTDE